MDKPKLYTSGALSGAREHAMVLLASVDGDYQAILDNMPMLIQLYGLEYAQRIEACIRPKGEA